MTLPDGLRVHAGALERLGRKHKHELGEWEAGEVSFDAGQLPPEVRARGVRAGAAIKLPRLACKRCAAWVQFITPDGVNCGSPTFDQDCTHAHTPATA